MCIFLYREMCYFCFNMRFAETTMRGRLECDKHRLSFGKIRKTISSVFVYVHFNVLFPFFYSIIFLRIYPNVLGILLTQYDQLLESYCRLSVRLSVRLSTTKCIVAKRYIYIRYVWKNEKVNSNRNTILQLSTLAVAPTYPFKFPTPKISASYLYGSNDLHNMIKLFFYCFARNPVSPHMSCIYTVSRTQYNRLSQQQLGFFFCRKRLRRRRRDSKERCRILAGIKVMCSITWRQIRCACVWTICQSTLDKLTL